MSKSDLRKATGLPAGTMTKLHRDVESLWIKRISQVPQYICANDLGEDGVTERFVFTGYDEHPTVGRRKEMRCIWMKGHTGIPIPTASRDMKNAHPAAAITSSTPKQLAGTRGWYRAGPRSWEETFDIRSGPSYYHHNKIYT